MPVLVIVAGILSYFIRMRGNNLDEYTDEALDALANERTAYVNEILQYLLPNLSGDTPIDADAIEEHADVNSNTCVRIALNDLNSLTAIFYWDSNKLQLSGVSKTLSGVITCTRRIRIKQGVLPIRALNRFSRRFIEKANQANGSFIETVVVPAYLPRSIAATSKLTPQDWQAVFKGLVTQLVVRARYGSGKQRQQAIQEMLTFFLGTLEREGAGKAAEYLHEYYNLALKQDEKGNYYFTPDEESDQR